MLFSDQLLKPRTDFFVRQKLTPVARRQAFFDFADKPLIVIDKARDGFLREGFGISGLHSGEPVQLGFHIGIEVNFHRLQSKDFRILSQRAKLNIAFSFCTNVW